LIRSGPKVCLDISWTLLPFQPPSNRTRRPISIEANRRLCRASNPSYSTTVRQHLSLSLTTRRLSKALSSVAALVELVASPLGRHRHKAHGRQNTSDNERAVEAELTVAVRDKNLKTGTP